MGEAHDGGEHRLAERRSLELHRAVATRLRARPELLQVARRRVSSWLTQGGRPSPFHDTLGYYAQGVGPTTATLPSNWEQRLVPVFSDATRGATGWCLEVHDLVLSKCVAWREKDERFCRAAASHGLCHRAVLLERAPTMGLEPELLSLVLGRVRWLFDG